MASVQSSQELPSQPPSPEPAPQPDGEPSVAPRGKAPNIVGRLIDGFLDLISSVPFGIVLLMLLIIACMIGMLIQQQELETFAGYFAELTPAEKLVYGNLGFFDIYHSRYFNLLLLMMSLNIILASIDHFPAAWSYLSRKKLTASPTFAMAQKFKEKVELPGKDRKELTALATEAARSARFRTRVTEQETRTTIFAERGVWNRLGAYMVHVALLTIFLGGFLTSRGVTGMVQITPKQSASRIVRNVFDVDLASSQHAVRQQELELPFTLEGLDIQQKLINKEGGIDAGNTLDWLTRVRINDPQKQQKTDALVHMNTPYDYRGYRFFQASFNPMGSARTIKLRLTAPGGQPQDVSMEREGETKLPDGTRMKYVEFNPHFIFTRDGQVDFGSTEYENPAAHIAYVTPDGKQGDLWAFNQNFLNEISNAPFVRNTFLDGKPFQAVLTDFEKVPLAHTLSVQYDPYGARVVYLGFGFLCLTLIGVFFFSHQRLWIVVEDGKIHLGGDSNRNRLGFEDRARRLVARIREPHPATGG